MPRKIELERQRDELVTKIEEARAILDDALGFDEDDDEEDDADDVDYDRNDDED